MPDVKKFLYFQLQDLPNCPIKDWPPRVSIQLWHLNIIVYLKSGAIGISWPLMLQFGIESLLSNIVILVMDVSKRRFERLRSMFDASEAAITKMVSEAVAGLHALRDAGAADHEMHNSMILSLCQLLLYFRCLPYARSPDRMARAEIQRLRSITKPPDMGDGTWLAEMASRLHSWRTLHGPLTSLTLQSELRELLSGIGKELSDTSVQKYVNIIRDMVKAWARAEYKGDMSLMPGTEELVRARSLHTPSGTRFHASLIDKINDLHVIYDIGVRQATDTATGEGDAGALMEEMLRHVVQSWDPSGEQNTNLLSIEGNAAPDALLHVRGESEETRHMHAATAVRYALVNDCLATDQQLPTVDAPLGMQSHGMLHIDNSSPATPDTATQQAKREPTRQELVQQLQEQRERFDHQDARINQLHANARLAEAEASRERAHLGLMVLTELDNGATTAMKHADNSGFRHDSDTIAAIAVDGTRDAAAPAAKPRFFRPSDRSGSLAHDVRRKNMGASRQQNAGRDRPVRMRLLDKPKIVWDDISDDCKTLLGSSFGINIKADWDLRGSEVCPLCPKKDHHLWHCVKVWPATDAGKKWLGTTKAAEIHSRLKTDGTLSVAEFINLLEADYDAGGGDERKRILDATCYVCDYADVDADGDFERMPADELMATVRMCAEGLSACHAGPVTDAPDDGRSSA